MTSIAKKTVVLFCSLFLLTLPFDMVRASEAQEANAQSMEQTTVTELTVPDESALSYADCEYFIYSKEYGTEGTWKRLEVDDSLCEVGYLYVKDFKTGNVIRVWDQPVAEFSWIHEKILMAATKAGKLIRLTAMNTATTIWESAAGRIFELGYTDQYLYFVDGITVMRYDWEADRLETLCDCENIVWLISQGDNLLYWLDSSGQYFEYHVDTGITHEIDEMDMYIGTPG